jgi:molybdate transport system regulatory protein
MKKVKIKGHFWVEMEEKDFLGPGRVELLERIGKFGSLRKAATSMGLSYRKAYYMIRAVNDLWSQPLVELKKGGPGGGRATLTKTGKQFVINYHQITQNIVTFLTKQGSILLKEI